MFGGTRGCSGPLGIEGGIVSNQQITASSTHRALFGLQKWYPYYARLNKKGLVNAWTAAENDRWPWIQINLQKKMRVTGVITQGAKRIGSPEYVKSYKIAYSNDGKSWTMYKVKGTNEDMVFRGNVDNNTPYANSFTPPIKSQYIRLYPQVCRRHCTLRMELLGCELSGCSEPLGMKSGHIQDYQITASSVFRTLNMDMFAWEPRKARLDKQGKVNAWTSGHNDQSQWLQFLGATILTSPHVDDEALKGHTDLHAFGTSAAESPPQGNLHLGKPLPNSRVAQKS
ncbi:PREDICTED: EGF-like repeat and discoidin I-like domain-containing protein 3 [Merops nubicus]|uniref:EGF-like repeat and discoidin I-like domain-containing protein 3 n=1 Tax=Merops nubicus TaxID=57421 RepID=UPI0004F0A6E0|nr:PREDICTED: EGF-like repeat and discoidin I-like domain-containing protein 3 [Merops nubicus]